MLTRAWLIASARAEPAARKLGLVGDAAGLWFRSRRLRSAWADHEARCHAVIGASVETLARHRTCLVLGSGQLRDIPLALLAARFEQILLADAVHLWPARRQARRFTNVSLLTVDLTGKLAEIAFGQPPTAPLARLLAEPGLDLIISANLLSQLAIAVEEALERQGGTETAIVETSRALVADHIAQLRQAPARTCLLSDVDMREIGRDGEVRARHDLLAGIALPRPDEMWDWPVAPFGVAEPDVAYIHRVHAYGDFA